MKSFEEQLKENHTMPDGTDIKDTLEWKNRFGDNLTNENLITLAETKIRWLKKQINEEKLKIKNLKK